MTGDDGNEGLHEHIHKLSKDLRKASKMLSASEARYLVDVYYLMQDDRKRANNQTLATGEEPCEVIAWYAENTRLLENQIKAALDKYSAAHPVGEWARSVKGIGPVIAAGLLAHIDITKAPTVGHIWRYAGLDPTQKWEKGQKRPWNARLKVLCWKIGQSFVKVSTGENPSPYGVYYREQKAKYVAINDSGGYAGRAATILTQKKIGKDTEAHKHLTGGKLPPAHVDQMAQRWATKLFLSHLHGFWYEHHHGEPPPSPYPIAILGHAHLIAAE